jgi:hypothetical protein
MICADPFSLLPFSPRWRQSGFPQRLNHPRAFPGARGTRASCQKAYCTNVARSWIATTWDTSIRVLPAPLAVATPPEQTAAQVRSLRRNPTAPLTFPTAPRPDGEKPNMGDQPRDPLAPLRVPPTPAQVLDHIHVEIDGLISFATQADMVAVAQLLEQAREEAEKLLAERDVPLSPLGETP